MGIAIREFEIAMETMGAKPLSKDEIPYNTKVPCFRVGDSVLVHSGSNFVVQQGTRASIDIMQKVKSELNGKCNDIIHLNEIYSIRTLFTLALMLENRYSKQSVIQLIDQTYSKILNSSILKHSISSPYHGINLKNANKLYELLIRYDKIINPFGEENVQIQNPAVYLNELFLDFSFDDSSLELPNVTVCLSGKESSTEFVSSPNALIYYAEYLNDETKSTYNGYRSFEHCLITDSVTGDIDEILTITLYKSASSNTNLNLSLKTGLAWKTSEEPSATPLTDSQLDFVISNFEKCISRIQKTITSKII